jgi:biopolymer transport protein ExbD
MQRAEWPEHRRPRVGRRTRSPHGTAESVQAPAAEINTTPLLDVMLVLLIIFMITVPLMRHSVRVDRPRATNTPTPEKPPTLQISSDAADNRVFVASEPVNRSSLEARIRNAVAQQTQVGDQHLGPDRWPEYPNRTHSTPRHFVERNRDVGIDEVANEVKKVL